MKTRDIARIIPARKTEKVLSETPLPAEDTTSIADEILEMAAWAPFHRPAHTSHTEDREQNAIMPWRFYVLDAADCRKLREELMSQDQSKIIQMLATADCLVQATWLPNPASKEGEFDGLFAPTLENMEHLAAASAAVQNFLLAATAEGYRTYWSSGGILRSDEVFQKLDIPRREILLGSLFIFPENLPEEAKVATSKLREKRGPLTGWMKRVDLGE